VIVRDEPDRDAAAAEAARNCKTAMRAAKDDGTGDLAFGD
jgi:hypothetical protein